MSRIVISSSVCDRITECCLVILGKLLRFSETILCIDLCGWCFLQPVALQTKSAPSAATEEEGLQTSDHRLNYESSSSHHLQSRCRRLRNVAGADDVWQAVSQLLPLWHCINDKNCRGVLIYFPFPSVPNAGRNSVWDSYLCFCASGNVMWGGVVMCISVITVALQMTLPPQSHF